MSEPQRIGSLPLEHPSVYIRRDASHSTFQLPTHLTSFSYSPTRELLLDSGNKDESVAIYREPAIGSDLNRGFEQAVWRDASVDEGLDSLLDTLANHAENDPTGAVDEMLGKIAVITWRGMLTKLMLAVYEIENSRKGMRADGWEMNAMLIDGCLYLEESNPPSKMAAKASNESSFALQSYYGYSFESFSTTCPPPTPAAASPSARLDPEDGFSVPNTNIQWCSVVKTNLGGFRTIIGGEVDCLRPEADLSRIETNDFIELKTNVIIQSQRDEVNFERLKLLKHYAQSFLLGVPTVTVGFRTRQGELSALQTFDTLDIPRLVRGKPHSWEPRACLVSARSILVFLHQTLSSYLAKCSDSSSSAAAEETIFRVSFSPKTESISDRPGVSIRVLEEEEIVRDVLGGKKVQERNGFLLKRWVEGVKDRRERLNHARHATSSSASNPTSQAAEPAFSREPSPDPVSTIETLPEEVFGSIDPALSSAVLSGLKR